MSADTPTPTPRTVAAMDVVLANLDAIDKGPTITFRAIGRAIMDPLRDCAAELERENLALREERDALRADKARLDWLADIEGGFGEFDWRATDALLTDYAYKGLCYVDLRAAIDAALSESA